MIVSIYEGQIIYGVDYSDRGAEIITITQEEFNKIQSGVATFDIESKEVVYLPPVEEPELTEEELQEIKDNTLVFISIPVPVALSPAVREKVEMVRYLYSTIIATTKDGYMTLENIVFRDIPSFLTKAEYEQFKSAGVIFHELIDELFTTKKK